METMNNLNILNNSTKLKLVKNKVYSKKKKENEIFVSRKRKNTEKFYYERAYQLLHDMNYREIYVCGLGACLNIAVRIALIVCESIPGYIVENVETSSVKHVDDFVDMETNEIEIRKQERMSNLIRIKIIKK